MLSFLTNQNKILTITKELVKKAIDDLESVTVGFNTGFIKNIKVFGHENSARIVTVVASTVSTLIANALITFIITFALCITAYLIF